MHTPFKNLHLLFLPILCTSFVATPAAEDRSARQVRLTDEKYRETHIRNYVGNYQGELIPIEIPDEMLVSERTDIPNTAQNILKDSIVIKDNNFTGITACRDIIKGIIKYNDGGTYTFVSQTLEPNTGFKTMKENLSFLRKVNMHYAVVISKGESTRSDDCCSLNVLAYDAKKDYMLCETPYGKVSPIISPSAHLYEFTFSQEATPYKFVINFNTNTIEVPHNSGKENYVLSNKIFAHVHEIGAISPNLGNVYFTKGQAACGEPEKQSTSFGTVFRQPYAYTLKKDSWIACNEGAQNILKDMMTSHFHRDNEALKKQYFYSHIIKMHAIAKKLCGNVVYSGALAEAAQTYLDTALPLVAYTVPKTNPNDLDIVCLANGTIAERMFEENGTITMKPIPINGSDVLAPISPDYTQPLEEICNFIEQKAQERCEALAEQVMTQKAAINQKTMEREYQMPTHSHAISITPPIVEAQFSDDIPDNTEAKNVESSSHVAQASASSIDSQNGSPVAAAPENRGSMMSRAYHRVSNAYAAIRSAPWFGW